MAGGLGHDASAVELGLDAASAVALGLHAWAGGLGLDASTAGLGVDGRTRSPCLGGRTRIRTLCLSGRARSGRLQGRTRTRTLSLSGRATTRRLDGGTGTGRLGAQSRRFGGWTRSPTRVYWDRIHMASFAASEAPMYWASIVKKATRGCLRGRQVTTSPASVNTLPDVGFHSSGSPGVYESV